MELLPRADDRLAGVAQVRDVVQRVVQAEDVDPVLRRGGDEAADEVAADRARADEEAAAEREPERRRRPALERPDALPGALDAATHGGVEDAAAGDLEAREPRLVEHLGERQQLGGRDLPRERFLREQANSGVYEPRHVVEPTEWGKRSKPPSQSARELGLDGSRAALLRDLTNVARAPRSGAGRRRVPMTFTRLRDRSWIERELEITSVPGASGRADRRTGAVCRSGAVRARRLSRHALGVRRPRSRTSGRHAPRRRGAARDPRAPGGSATRRGCEHFARLEEIGALVATLELTPEERSLFDEGLAAARSTVEGIDAGVATRARGRASLEPAAHAVGAAVERLRERLPRAARAGPRLQRDPCPRARPGPEDDELLAGYGDFDQELVPAADPGARALPRRLDVRARRADAVVSAARDRTAGLGPRGLRALGRHSAASRWRRRTPMLDSSISSKRR